VEIDVLEVNSVAGVGFIAPDDAWGKESAVRHDVAKGDVCHGNERLSFALFIERVKHAAGATSIRLLLLLRPDVYIPPDGVVNHNVLVHNVGYLST